MDYIRQFPLDASVQAITTVAAYYLLIKKGHVSLPLGVYLTDPLGYFAVYGSGAIILGAMWPLTIPVLIADAYLNRN